METISQDHRSQSFASQKSTFIGGRNNSEMDRPLPARRKFHFVDSSPSGRLTADAKAHIASESNRQKRLRQVQAFRKVSSSTSSEVAKVSPEGETISPEGAKTVTTPSTSSTDTSPDLASNGFANSPPRKRARTLTPPSPLSLVERNLIDLDPFETMPAKMNHSAKYLVGLISPMFMETSFCSAQWGETFITSFGLSLWYNNPCKLYNMLESISSFVDTQRGRQLSQETMRWRSAGIRALNAMLDDPGTRYGNDVLMGITGLMHSQTVYDSDAQLQMHVHSRAMALVLRHRGGIEGLKLPPSIEGYVSVVSITSSKAQIAHLDYLETGAAGLAEVEDWKQDVNFVDEVLSELSQWSKWPTLATNDFSQWHYQILGKLVDPLNVPRNDVEESHQLFILCFLSMTKWRFREDRETWLECVREMETLTRALDTFCSLPNVSWLLMDVINKKSGCKWQALRAIKVLHRLSTPKRVEVKELFFALVTGNTLATTLTQGSIIALRQDFMAGLPQVRRGSYFPGN